MVEIDTTYATAFDDLKIISNKTRNCTIKISSDRSTVRAVHESVWFADSVGKMENQCLLSLVQLLVQIGQNRSNRFELVHGQP